MAAYVFEFIGTFFFLLTIALTGNPLAIGFVLAVLVYAGGKISGAHYNPAVTLALLLQKKITTTNATNYVLFQFAGGLVASFLTTKAFNTPLIVSPAKEVSWISALLAEFIFTFLLVTTVLHVAISKKTSGNQYFGLSIGGSVLVGAFAVGKISGGALNPVVGISPLIANTIVGIQPFDLSLLFLYLIGPITAAILASFFYQYTQKNG